MKSALLLIAIALSPMPFACAQGAPTPPNAMPGPKPMPCKSMMKHDVHIMSRHESGASGLMLPPGAWWKSGEVAQKIGLTPDQQKRIEDIFLQSRVELVDRHAALEKQELILEPLLSANPIDQGKALAQINKIADTRAELEKTNAKMLLGIRAVLSADQWTKLQSMHHHFHAHGADGMKMHHHDHDGPDMHTKGPRPNPGRD